jgi:hypothetical protein
MRVTYQLSPEDYQRALNLDAACSWHDQKRKPVWQGRRIWRQHVYSGQMGALYASKVATRVIQGA